MKIVNPCCAGIDVGSGSYYAAIGQSDSDPPEKPYKRNNKNSVNGLDFNRTSYQYFGGVDLYKYPGSAIQRYSLLSARSGPKGFWVPVGETLRLMAQTGLEQQDQRWKNPIEPYTQRKQSSQNSRNFVEHGDQERTVLPENHVHIFGRKTKTIGDN